MRPFKLPLQPDMEAPVSYRIFGQQCWLSGQRAVFWEEAQSLIASDLHFGKTGHFRKAGIPVPQKVFQEDLQRLVSLLQYFRPKQLLVVGDFFHSAANTELDWFRKWRDEFSALDITLVRGNHDILHDKWYKEAGITVKEDAYQQGSFLFIHEHCETRPDVFTFCGHLHPGVIINGDGRQTLRFPCFYFGTNHCILPAFSRFTGMAAMDLSDAEQVFAVVNQSLIPLKNEKGKMKK